MKKSMPDRKNGRPKQISSPSGASPRNYGLPLPGMNDEEFGGSLIVIEGMDGSGRSTQISLLTEWLESEGFAVQTMGLRRSGLVAKDIDALLAENTITRMTLTTINSSIASSRRCGPTSSFSPTVTSTR